IATSRPLTMTPTNMQPSIATRARWLRRPETAWNRLENAWPESPAGAASDAMSLDMRTSSLSGRRARCSRASACAAFALLHVAPPLVGFAQLPADRLVRVLGEAALARLADGLGDGAAARADLAHAARLRQRRARRRGRRRPRALRVLGTSSDLRFLLGALRCGAALVALLVGRGLRLRLAVGL